MSGAPRIQQSPTDPDFVQNPYPFYARARALGPLVYWDEYNMVCTTTFAATQTVLKDRRFGRAPIAPPPPSAHLQAFHALEQHSLLELEPPDHTRLRRLIVKAFTSRHVDGLAPEIERLCHAQIDVFPTGAFDLIAAYATPVPVAVIAKVLGVPRAHAPDLLHWSNAMVAMYQARRDRAIEDAANTAAADFTAFLIELIANRRAHPQDDLISHLIAVRDEGEVLSTAELISICVLLLNAGHEATVHTIGNGVKALLETGRGHALLPADAMLPAVEEVLRYDPPLHLFTRIAYEPVTLFGHLVDRGDQVGCLLAAAAHDPAMTEDPERFDPSRTTSAHLSLGVGLHFCVGAPLAKLELQIALRVLFARCPKLRLVTPPRYANLYHFHGLERLMVQV